MTDKRWEKLGELLVNQSLQVKPKEKVMIMMMEVESYSLAKAAYTAVIKAGGFAQIQFMSEAIKHQILKYGNDEQISWIPEIEMYGMDWADCYLALRGGFNLNECWDIENDKIAKYQKAMGVVSTARWQKTRWILCRVPNERFAQQANVSYDKMMDMFFDACFVDLHKEKQRYTKVLDKLRSGKHFHIVSSNTDLHLDVKSDTWLFADGFTVVPDDELFSTPYWQSANGHITFEFPATIGGKVINNLRLDFKDGICIKATADTNQEYANKILDSDENSRKVGEFAFGINKAVDIITTDILIDEKFGGTMHIAMGRPYDGEYYSAIHWDIIKDSRIDTEIYMDNELIFKNGKFNID